MRAPFFARTKWAILRCGSQRPTTEWFTPLGLAETIAPSHPRLSSHQPARLRQLPAPAPSTGSRGFSAVAQRVLWKPPRPGQRWRPGLPCFGLANFCSLTTGPGSRAHLAAGAANKGRSAKEESCAGPSPRRGLSKATFQSAMLQPTLPPLRAAGWRPFASSGRLGARARPSARGPSGLRGAPGVPPGPTAMGPISISQRSLAPFSLAPSRASSKRGCLGAALGLARRRR
mmetsp:Transcript_17133/g.39479  ORF Transcript_17133/g.39479 Transcript_17133/m.39479 type:complete len:230 (+) Transcript_17133:599-1288(+)